MLIKDIILEKRRFQQKSLIASLAKYEGDHSIYITFTDVNKVGINPRFEYNNPLGIYAYPLYDVWLDLINDNLPFASDRPFVHVLRSKVALKDVSQYSLSDYNNDVKLILKYYSNELKIKEGEIKGWEVSNSPFLKLWNVTRMIANLFWKTQKSNTSIKWNSIFRRLGYVGFTDTRGMGYIHGNEPKQTVFFTSSGFTRLETIRNKKIAIVDEFHDLSELTELFKTPKRKLFSEQLAAASKLSREWSVLLMHSQSDHFSIASGRLTSFWENAPNQWTDFVQALLSYDFTNLPKLADEIISEDHLKSNKYAKDFFYAVEPSSVTEAKLFLNTMLDMKFLYHLVEGQMDRFADDDTREAYHARENTLLAQCIEYVLKKYLSIVKVTSIQQLKKEIPQFYRITFYVPEQKLKKILNLRE